MQEYLYKLATDKHQGFFASVLKAFLFILSLLYGLIIRLLVFIQRLRPSCLNCKVISVGNITLGGTGKTALVEYIARYLKQKGHKIAILSRGYKVKTPSAQLSAPSWETMGDEPYMLSKNLGDIPVIVDANRVRAAKEAIKNYHVDNVILDDGFQQWCIKKDLEIVTVNATKIFGNRHVIPRGILREPLSALKRADVFVLTKTNLSPGLRDIKYFLSRINPSALIAESIHSPIGFYKLNKTDELLNTGLFKGKAVTLFSGIGDPDSFENLITELGINIGLSFWFPDHYNYSQKNLENIAQESEKKNIDTIITTEKDAARICNLQLTGYKLQIFILRIELKITRNEEEFHQRLLRLYHS